MSDWGGSMHEAPPSGLSLNKRGEIVMELRMLRMALMVTTYTTWYVVILHALIRNGEDLIGLVLALFIPILICSTCIVDARILGRPILHSARFAIVATWPIAVPVYLLWSRGASGLWTILIHFGLITCCAFASGIFFAVLQAIAAI